MLKYSFINSILSLFLLAFSVVYASGQNNNFIFDHYSTNDGLSQSTVKCIFKDSQGFMWIGTENGLNKFDGYDFTVYRHKVNDSTSISGNRITSIIEDKEGYLWVSTYLNGLNRYNRTTDKFEQYLHDSKNSTGISHNSVTKVFEDNSGNIWACTNGGGLNLFNKDDGTFKHFKNDSQNPRSIASNYVATIKQHNSGILWMADNAGNLMSFNTKTQEFSNYLYTKKFSGQVRSEIFGNIYIDSNDKIWIGSEKGLFVFDINTQKIKHFTAEQNNSINKNAVSGIHEVGKGIYWILTDHGGINVYNSKTDSFSYIMHKKFDTKTLSNNQVYCLYVDDDENYWVGNYNGGLNVCYKNKYKFEVYTPEPESTNCLNHESIVSICESTDGKIWIGTDGKGINILDPKTRKFKFLSHSETDKNSLSGDVILSVFSDDNNVWAGTYLNGLNKININTGKVEQQYKNNIHSEQSLSNNNVWDIIGDEKGNLWIATNGKGINYFDKQTKTFTSWWYNKTENSISGDDVQTIFLDSENQLWIGTSISGLNKYNIETKQFTHYKYNDNDTSTLPNNRVCEIFEDAENNLWIGSGGGLSLYNKKADNFITYTRANGLPDNLVKSIIADKTGYLWIGTGKGLCKFNPLTSKVVNFDMTDGLPSNEFNYNTALFSNDGKIYFGLIGGVISFYPDSVKTNNKKPNIVITDFQMYNNSITEFGPQSVLKEHINSVDTIILTHKQSVFTIKYASLSFLSPLKNKYAYKLDGFDEEWNYVGNQRKVTYTNLDPATYTFKVKGTNNDGVWNDEGVSVVIVVLPPWWETWLVKAILIVLLIIALYSFYLYKVKEIQIQQEILKTEVGKRTKELYESNTELEELYQEMNQQKEELETQTEILAKTNKKLELSTEELENHKNNLEELVKERTIELEKSKEKAEESDRLKTAFLANMSHEIRTPMNAIVGFSNLLKSKAIDEKAKENYVAQITSNTKSLLILIDDILDLSMMESNLLTIQKKDFELNTLLDEVFLDGSLRNADLDLKLSNNIEDLELVLNSDRYRIKQILVNLFNNACKFTNEGYVDLACDIENDKLNISVEDSGIGISQENIGVIFNRFMKITDDKTKLFRGAGLGLAISKKISAILNGELHVDSELGKGSRFTLSLPIDIIVKKKKSSPNVNEEPNYNWLNKSILVVEDEETNFAYIESALHTTKAKILWAQNGQVAVDLFEEGQTFDVVLMDIKMPIMNGYDAAVAIKNKNPNQVIIAQTAYARTEDYIEIKKAGFNDYLIKPIIPEDLYSTINLYLNKQA